MKTKALLVALFGDSDMVGRNQKQSCICRPWRARWPRRDGAPDVPGISLDRHRFPRHHIRNGAAGV